WMAVVATVAENQHGFHRFAQQVGAKSVYQLGNARQWVDWGLDQAVLVSTSQPIPEGARAVRYMQEFDKDDVFGFRPPRREQWFLDGGQSVGSFVNLLERMPEQWRRFTELEDLLPRWRFETHGHESRDGFVQPHEAVAEAMAGFGFGWHDKPSG